MGTNFYMESGEHIGKRSAAGMYCWDCGVTLCAGGERAIHYDGNPWRSSCPECGKRPTKEGLGEGSAGRELGFNTSKPVKKQGVASCSSFTWALQIQWLGGIETVKDEYGRVYTIKEFWEMLNECPVRYYDQIGQEFS